MDNLEQDLAASLGKYGAKKALVAEGRLPTAYATDDGVGLIYRNTQMTEAVTHVDGKYAYLVESGTEGQARETLITPRLLA